MAHLEKFKAKQVTAICKHDSRQQGDGVEHSNESIENERTHLNYNLASEQQSLSATAFLKERLSECRVLKRADVNVMCSWAVTLPKDFEGDERKFFQESYDFLCKRYGEENVVSAWVHMDENQPHLHFKFIPVTQGKDGADKVSAKEVVNRSDLRSFHTDLQKHLENALQCPCNVLNGVTNNGNKTINQLKAETLKKENDVLQKKILEQKNIIDEKNKIIDSFTPKKKIFGKQESDAELIVRNKKIIEEQAEELLSSVKQKEKNFNKEYESKRNQFNAAAETLKTKVNEVNEEIDLLEKEKLDFAKEKQNYEVEIKVNAKFYLDNLLKQEKLKLDRSDTLTQDHFRALQRVEERVEQSISQASQKGNRSDYER